MKPAAHQHEQGTHCQCLPVVERTGSAEKAENGDRHRRRLRTRNEQCRAKFTMLTVKANTAPTSSARRMSGQSISSQTRCGSAPNIPCSFAQTGRNAAHGGQVLRMTNGIATNVCAMGTRTIELRRLSGGLSSEMM